MKQKKNGFTLVEMIAVIIIIGILAIITVPAVSRYINNSRNKTYEAYEENMEVAANNRITSCVSENNDKCNIPEDGEKVVYYLTDLIETGYIDELKDPESEGYCNNVLSYVEVSNDGKENYSYSACLYCSNYATEKAECQEYNDHDEDKPECGEVTGESTKWTNKNRTISVKCSDKSSGCIMNEFTKTFKEPQEVGYIEIADKSGNVQQCPVNVYIEKTKPTCELEQVGGKLEATGWYSGDVTVKLKNPEDGESGVQTYGIGTSINDKDYRKQTEITLKQGYTTVFGYVKDKAGNEGVCTLDVKIGAPQPEFDIEYGYQIYPNKESYTLKDMTESGTTLTSTSNDPGILFTGLEKYRNVNRIVVHLNNSITKTNEQAQVFYSNGTHSETQSTRIILPTNKTKFEIPIPQGTYKNIRLDLGETSGDSYDISKIELMVGDRSILYTNKDVSINLRPKNEKVRTTEYSFDNGATWQTPATKVFPSNYTNIAKTKNIATLISEPQNISINNIDKNLPAVTITATKSTNGTEVATNNWSNQTLNFKFTSSNVGISGATIYYCKDTANTCNPTTAIANNEQLTTYNTVEGIYYIRYRIISGAGTVSETSSYTAKVDLTAPTITNVTGNPTNWVNTDVTLTVNGAADSGSGLHATSYSFDNGTTWQSGNTKTYTANTSNIIIKVRDAVGNTYTHPAITIDKIDKIAPTCKFTLGDDYHTAKVTCTDTGGSGIKDSGTSWILENGENRKKEYTATDYAGNKAPSSHTYRYDGCRTGENTCEPGCDNVWSDCAYEEYKCGASTYSYTYSGGCSGSGSGYATYSSAYNKCESVAPCTNFLCNITENKNCGNKCVGGYINENCSECYKGHNTCAGGFYLN